MVFQVGGYEPSGDKSFVYLTFSVLNHIISWLFKPLCKKKQYEKFVLISTTALQKISNTSL